MMLLDFSGIERPVALDGCGELVAPIDAVLRGWRIEAGPPKPPAEARPVIALTKTGGNYVRTSRWLSEPAIFSDPVNATCDFLVDLMRAYVADNHNLLCLHCAAVRFGRGLVVFPNAYGAGKSVLAAGLVKGGRRLFADDVLPIDSIGYDGIAPGVLPRLRLPLPEDAAPGLAGFVAERPAPRSDRFAYFDPGAEGLAPLGERAPILGMVLLDRQPGCDAEMIPATTGEILKAVILRNFSYNHSGLETLDRLHQIVAGARRFRIRYGTIGAAMELLAHEFDD